jgi:hypothetical protein
MRSRRRSKHQACLAEQVQGFPDFSRAVGVHAQPPAREPDIIWRSVGKWLPLVICTAALTSVVAGCSSNASKPPTLKEWASSVCGAFTHSAIESNADVRYLESTYKALNHDLYRDESPGRVSPSLLRSISRGRLLAVVRNFLDRNRRLATTLEALEAHDRAAGRQGRKILAYAIADLRDGDRSTRELESKVRKLPAHPIPTQLLNMTDLILLGEANDPLPPAHFMAMDIGAAKSHGYPALTEAFKDADGCESWSKDIAYAERYSR